MASVLLSAFTVCMFVILFLISDDTQPALLRLKSHFDECRGERRRAAKRLYAAASAYRCALSMRRHTTMLHDKKGGRKSYLVSTLAASSFHAFPRRFTLPADYDYKLGGAKRSVHVQLPDAQFGRGRCTFVATVRVTGTMCVCVE